MLCYAIPCPSLLAFDIPVYPCIQKESVISYTLFFPTQHPDNSHPFVDGKNLLRILSCGRRDNLTVRRLIQSGVSSTLHTQLYQVHILTLSLRFEFIFSCLFFHLESLPDLDFFFSSLVFDILVLFDGRLGKETTMLMSLPLRYFGLLSLSHATILNHNTQNEVLRIFLTSWSPLSPEK